MSGKTQLLVILLSVIRVSMWGQPAIYTDPATLITGTWAAAGSGGSATLTEVMTNAPYEGTHHYRFDYSFTGWWAGAGLNMDNWGSGGAKDLSGYTHLRIAYRGLGSGQKLSIQLRNGSVYGNTVEVGGSASDYTLVDVPVIALTAGTAIDIHAIREVDISVGNVQSGSGTVYFDNIVLVNGAVGSPASGTTWARANSFYTGINLSNWLEAYWLMPFGDYPDFDRYNRTNVHALRDAGFEVFRLPVTFERLAPTSPPYTINFNQTAFQLVDSMILWANLYNFKLIIDNHHGYELTDANYNGELTRLQAIWGQLAIHYGDLDPERFFFELYNEPTPTISNANFRTVASELVATIRANEPQMHTIFVGANNWNSGNALIGFTPLDDQDIIYTFHSYDPFYFTHQGFSWTSPPYFPPVTFPQSGEIAAINNLFASVQDWSDAYDVPVSLGEYGCSDQADAASRCNWISTFANAYNSNNISNFYWDAISNGDGFGFYANGVVLQANVIPCFATAIGLYNTPMAVDFQHIALQCRDGVPFLRWSADASDPGDFFVVERSADGARWETAATIPADPDRQWYTFSDQAGSSTFYRLAAVSADGTRRYTAVQRADCAAQDAIAAAPNPTHGSVELRFSDRRIEGLQLYNANGQLLRSWADVSSPSFTVSMEDLPNGWYLFRVLTSAGAVEQVPVLVED